MNRSKTILAVVGVVALAVSAFFIHRAVAVSGEARRGLEARDRAFSDLEKVYKDEIFPSPANVVTVKGDVGRYGEVRDSFANALAAKNIQPPSSRITPSAFMQALQAFVVGKIKEARDPKSPVTAGKVKVADDFAFGFDRYIGAPVMPQNDDVPRLVQQLLITRKIVDVLFAARVVEFKTMTREVFEGGQLASLQSKPAPSASETTGRKTKSGGNVREGKGTKGKFAAPEEPEEPLFTSQRFTVTFLADEHAMLSVMNALSSLDCFAVVSDMRIAKSAPDVRPPEVVAAPEAEPQRPRRSARTRRPRRGGGDDGGDADDDGAVPAAAPKELTLAQRLMTGPDIEPPLEVSLAIDVYSFKAPKAGKEAE
jgi:hypothetical protein